MLQEAELDKKRAKRTAEKKNRKAVDKQRELAKVTAPLTQKRSPQGQQR